MLSLTKIFYCFTKNVNLKSRPSENFLEDFCTSEIQFFQQQITWRLFSLVFLIFYITFYMLVMYVVPLTILVVLNIAIGLTIHRARLHRHSIVANGYASSNEFTRTSQDFSRTASSYNEGPAMVLNGSQSRRTRYVNL